MRTLTQPHRNNASLFLRNMLHDSRFWAVLGIVAFIIAFTIFVIWAAQSGSFEGTGPRVYYPYGPYPVPMGP
jgi:hypothetical protein